MTKKSISLLILIMVWATTVTAQIRFCNYNVLNFPGSTGASRIVYFQTVLDQIQPDLLVCQEMVDDAGAQQFFEGVLDTSEFDRAGWVTQGTSEYMLYYKQDLFDLVDIHTVLTDLRNWEIYELEYIGGSTRPNLFIATTHLKASQGSDNEYRRLIECEALIDWLALNPLEGNNLIVCGDFNFYYSDEPGYQALLTEGEFIDPIDTPGYWHDSATFASVHTQSTRVLQFGGGATGGMDDRFDFALVTPELVDGEGWEYSTGTYTSYGNDGQHFNQAINDPPNTAVSAEVADALHEATDHLPVYLDLNYIQASPVTVVLTPHNPPITIPETGGDLIFDVYVENISTSPQDFDAWLEIAYEGEDPTTVVQRSFTDYQPGWTVNRPDMWFPISATYATGNYTFTGKVGDHPDDAWDQSGFPFVKEGTVGVVGFTPFKPADAPDPFADITRTDGTTIPNEVALVEAYPNPFNPSTVISYKMQVASYVSLAVYDIAGRKVTDLVDGWRVPGKHEVVFDAEGLAGGVYICRLRAGNKTSHTKVLLVK